MIPVFLILAALAHTPSEPGSVTGSAAAAGSLAGSVTAAGAGDVFVCEFEEQADRDYDGWPDGWTRHHRRELPEFLRIGIVAETEDGKPAPASAIGAPSATNHCLQIEPNGGGAAVTSPTFAVSPQFSLLLTMRIKTAGLVHDSAWAELALLDDAGQVLQTYEGPRFTEAVDWQTIRIGPLAAINTRASQATITLHLQPKGKREDLSGRAAFDDIRVVRLPRMQLQPSSPTGVYTKRETPELACSVSGIRVRNPRVRFELYDHLGERLAESSTPLLSPQDAAKWAAKELPADGYAGHTSWSPPIPDFGFYRVRASLLAEDSGEALLDRSQTLAVLKPLAPVTRSEFGWTLPGGEGRLGYGPLATLLGQAGLGWAKMPVWFGAKQPGAADRIAWFAEQLSIQNIELVAILDQPPDELREVFREQGRLLAASVFAEPELWQPAVGPIMTRLSLKVHWWQLGDDNDISFVGYPQLDTKIAEIKRHLEQYGQQIRLGINWRWVYAPPKSGGARAPWAYISYGMDPPLTADETAAYLQAAAAEPAVAKGKESKGSPASGGAAVRRGGSTANPASAASSSRRGPRRWLLLPPLPRSEYSSDVRVQDLVLRMLATKMQAADAVFVPEPFSDEMGLMNADGSPGELFVPWRTTAALIGGTDYLGPIQLPGGSTGHVFARDGRAVMAVWSDKPTSERVFLGDEVDQIDIWGRRVGTREATGRPLEEFSIGTMPTFITGLSEAVTRWQSALTFESSQLSSVAGREQTITLRLTNTFPQSVNGELTLHAPKSWGFDPRPVRFKIAEGDTLKLPLPVTLMADANSGPQPVRLDFDVAGYHFSVHRTLQLGLDDVQVEMTSRMRKDGALLVEQHLTNLSDRPLSFQCVLFPPDRRRETRQISLGRERSTLVFVLPEGEQLIGKKLWLRAEEIGGSRVLNYTLTAER